MEEAKIYKAIIATMNDIGAIGKTSVNQQQGFKYRGIDTVMNAMQPALIKNGIFVVPEALEESREERTSNKGTAMFCSRVKMKFTFYATDGSSVSAVTIGEALDMGDKATNKAMSIAFKYALFQTFCIPTEEMVDPDAECHEVKPKGRAITPEQLSALTAEMLRTGVTSEQICSRYKIPDMLALSDTQYDSCLKGLKQTKAKAS